jgi:hypothetical protein
VEVSQGRLLDDHAAVGKPWVGGAGLGELAALLDVPWRRVAVLPPRPLFHCQVPHIPGVRAVAHSRNRDSMPQTL